MTKTRFSDKDKKSHLCAYSLEDRKETVLGDVNNYQITFDGKKMLVKIKKDYAIIDLPKDKIETKDHELKLQGLDMQLDRHAEWNQIYFECWRQMRDFFFSPNMNGIDWKAMRDKYAALVPFVNHRNDLTYLLGELIGELNNGHAYVGGGERPETPRIKLGLLGAELSRDPATRAYRIDRILPGENWDKKTRSPLTDIGVNVKPGDYILAINGTPVSTFAKPLRRAHRHRRQTSDPAREFQTDRRRRARRHRCADCRRIAALLHRLGAKEHRLRDQENRRRGWLHSHSRHGPARPERVHEALLSADPEKRAHC